MIIRKKDKGTKLIYPGVDKNDYLLFKNGTVKVAKTGQTKHTWISGKGYRYIQLHVKGGGVDNKSKTVSVHRLLALHFIKKSKADIKYKRDKVHFKDFDKNNLDLDNLEWVNLTELNIKTDIYYNDPRTIAEYAESICILLSKGYDTAEICKVLGVNKKKFAPFIGKIAKRQIYKSISSKYKF